MRLKSPLSALRLRRMIALLLSAVLLASAAPPPGQAAAPLTFADPVFGRVWQRTDGPVAAGTVTRSWVWGPGSWAAGREPYDEAPGGARLVQYFDKGRMEINDPTADRTAPGYVTSGLLVVEMVSGVVQLGATSTHRAAPAAEPVAGDPRPVNPDAPDYAAFLPVASLAGNNEAADRTGQPVDATLSRTGIVGHNATLGQQVHVATFNNVPALRHNIPDVFWTFLNSRGPLVEEGAATTGPLLDWLFSVGYPITEPYWVRARVDGQPRDLLVQLFQRRVLTYDPAGPDGWRVQMGNVGQHYYRWRYELAKVPPALAPASLPRYGVDTNWQSDAPLLAMAAGTGTGLVRLGMAWSAIEPDQVSPRRYNWDAYDAPLRRLAGAGLTPLGSINECPAWACTYPEGPLDRATPAQMAAFMTAVVQRYSAPPYNVHLWELFNEPDQTHGPLRGWGLHTTEYANLLRTVVPAIRTADPQAKIFLGGLAYDWFTDEGGPFNRGFLGDILSLAPNYFDYINFHYYPQNVHWPTIADKVAELKSVLAQAKLNKPLVCTETGITSSGNPEFKIPNFPPHSPENQARWLVKVHAQGFAAGLASIAWFPVQDFQTDVPGWQIFTESGLISFGGSPKPAYTAYQTFVREVGDAPFVRTIPGAELGAPNVAVYEFARPDARLWVAWNASLGITPATSLPKLSNATVVRDLYGRVVPVGTRIPVGADPIFIEIR